MRSANVYYKNEFAGIIYENDDEYVFEYDKLYLENKSSKPISLTLPLTSSLYKSKILFPFFDGLIPEGWLLDIAIKNWKVNPRDRFGLLMYMCQDCIGCVSIFANE